MLGEFSTIGYSAGLFQKSPKEILAALRTLNLHPVLTLNCLHYYKDSDITSAIALINLDGPNTDRCEEVLADAE